MKNYEDEAFDEPGKAIEHVHPEKGVQIETAPGSGVFKDWEQPQVTIDRAKLEQVLEALQEVYWSSRGAKHDEAIATIKEALEDV